MRACNGCRKRKIKCDAATTNTWPCSACTRLKLVCVPPTAGQESEFPTGQTVGSDPTGSLGAPSTQQPSHHAFPMPQTFRDGGQVPIGSIQPYNDGMGVFSQFMPPPHPQPGIYGDVRSPPIAEPQHHYQQPQMFSAPQTQQQSLGTPDNSLFLENDQSTAENLSEVLGELKIDETGIGMMSLSPTKCFEGSKTDVFFLKAPYIRQQRQDRSEPEVPIQDDAEERLPPLSTGAGSAIRIPPELMPPDDEVMSYFKTYFDHIHPYVPAIHRSHLYYQWQNDRSSISPLLLEALFACAGRMSDDLAQGAQWLALANSKLPGFDLVWLMQACANAHL